MNVRCKLARALEAYEHHCTSGKMIWQQCLREDPNLEEVNKVRKYIYDWSWQLHVPRPFGIPNLLGICGSINMPERGWFQRYWLCDMNVSRYFDNLLWITHIHATDIQRKIAPMTVSKFIFISASSRFEQSVRKKSSTGANVVSGQRVEDRGKRSSNGFLKISWREICTYIYPDGMHRHPRVVVFRIVPQSFRPWDCGRKTAGPSFASVKDRGVGSRQAPYAGPSLF